MALKMNFREVTPEDTEILRMIALRNGKAEDYADAFYMANIGTVYA